MSSAFQACDTFLCAGITTILSKARLRATPVLVAWDCPNIAAHAAAITSASFLPLALEPLGSRRSMILWSRVQLETLWKKYLVSLLDACKKALCQNSSLVHSGRVRVNEVRSQHWRCATSTRLRLFRQPGRLHLLGFAFLSHRPSTRAVQCPSRISGPQSSFPAPPRPDPVVAHGPRLVSMT